MRRSRSTLAAAPPLGLALIGAGCGGDGDEVEDAPTEQDRSETEVEPGGQTNSDESRPEGEEPANTGGSDNGAGGSDGEDGSGSDDGGNRDTEGQDDVADNSGAEGDSMDGG